MRIEVKNLSHVYNPSSPFAKTALNGVSLTVEEGEFFGLIGHTGSGKSTFVQHLNGLIKVPSADKKAKKKKRKKGEVVPETILKVGDYDLTNKKTDFKALRSRVGMVFQYPEYQLFAESVKEDVAFGLKNFEKDIYDDETRREEAVRSAIELVGLNYDEIKDKSPFDLSGGQQRRVAIAGVIVTRPEVLVLDEPAAGLDPIGKKSIMSLLHKIHGEWCKTVIFVSHDMDEISENCTRAAVFSEGKIVAVDTPRNLFKRADYLMSLGLDIPKTAKITNALKKYGIDIDSDFTVEDFINKTLALYREKKGDKQ